ncbi:hypothetical protein TSUD_408370 [Trifolium subterraneum]|uniref:Reverse transcriptase domain-containing protein n=1 Tax=Trifolium subterraneum TaxID=3900 RepID=A0A2Z6PHW5_TRISU|nr:hypothetical protein TSUD_408370 [Trifolium subterraneum]
MRVWCAARHHDFDGGKILTIHVHRLEQCYAAVHSIPRTLEIVTRDLWKFRSLIRRVRFGKKLLTWGLKEMKKKSGNNSGAWRQGERIEFIQFIDALEVVDIPLKGKMFTWFNSDGSAMSRLDRFLVSEDFIEKGKKAFIIKENLKGLKEALKVWNREVFGFMELKIDKTVKELNEVEELLATENIDANIINPKELVRQFWEQLNFKESLLHKKSRTKWAQEGDSNSRYFHASIKSRHRRNQIVTLKKDGEWIQGVAEIKEEVRDHYSKHFVEEWSNKTFLQGINFNTLSADDNTSFLQPFVEEEVRDIIWSCDGNKSPGPDGFNLNFFKACWSIVKDDVMAFLTEFHENAFLPKALTASFLTLIPKKDHPQNLFDYRPICLIGSLYKILSKLSANRMKRVSMSVLVNGNPTADFNVGRGLRQGDPLSPFLFLIVAEGLTGLMRKAVELGKFKGYRLNNNIQFHILQFADDTILMGEGIWDHIWIIKTLLRSFELASGLKINFVKSKLYGLNVDSRLLEAGSAFLSCRSEVIPFKFLGIPVGTNPRRQETWKPVVDAMIKRLNSWSSRQLSYGGRITLINSVLASLPLYFFSFFKAPCCVIKQLVRIQRNVLWGGGINYKKLCWVKWDQICLPKESGGLGVKNLELFNLALLSKWKWRLLSEGDAIWADLLRFRYGHLPTQMLGRETHLIGAKHSIWWKDVVSLGRGFEAD